jgi:hypothetical protein
MEEEFTAMNAPFMSAAKSDEQLTLIASGARSILLFTASITGRRHRLCPALPKPRRHWVGGEGKYAQRRAGRFGDAWFPYFVKITPKELAAGFANVRVEAKKAGRNPDEVQLACCLPVELTPTAGPPITDYLKGSLEQFTERLKQFIDVGVIHIGLQFMIPHYPERQEQIDRFAREVLPSLKAYVKT